MQDYVIIAIVLIAVVIAVIFTVKHFNHQSGCCGGSSYKVKRKKLVNVKYTKVFTVEGMHCVNCKNRVEEVIGDIRGVAGKVDLKNNELLVSYAEDVDDNLIKSRIERAGYTVTDIK